MRRSIGKLPRRPKAEETARDFARMSFMNARSLATSLAIAVLLAACSTVRPSPVPEFIAYNAATDTLPAPEEDAAFVAERARIRGHRLTDAERIENLVMLYGLRLRGDPPEGFDGLALDRPAYRYVSVFARPPVARDRYLALAAPEIRDLVVFTERHFDQAMQQQAQERLSEIFGTDSGACSMHYAPDEDRIVLGIDDDADSAAISAKIPQDLAPYVRMARGYCIVVT